MLLLSFAFFKYEIATGKGNNPAFYSIITIFNAVLYTYKAIKISEKRKYNLIIGLIWSLLSVMLVLEYFKVI